MASWGSVFVIVVDKRQFSQVCCGLGMVYPFYSPGSRCLKLGFGGGDNAGVRACSFFSKSRSSFFF